MTLSDKQFNTHIDKFKEQTGVNLLRQHLVVGDQVVPTVRQNLTFKQKDGRTAYMMSATITGEEGNHHEMMVHTLNGSPFYGLALSRNSRHRAHDAQGNAENLDTNDLQEFSSGIQGHLKKAAFTPPSSHPSTSGIPMSERGVINGYLEEWHRTGKLRAVEVHDWDKNESETRTYDPVTEKYI